MEKVVSVYDARRRQLQVRPRLLAAFDQLREDGYFAEPDWQCCQSCGLAALPDDADEYIFFHDQDADDLRRGNSCFLSWGGNPVHIIKRLEEAGLVVDWDGSDKVRLQVRARMSTDTH
jgi:hypothetical protein